MSLQIQMHLSHLTACMTASERGVSALTLTTVPTKAPCYISGLDGPFLTGLQENKQSLELVRDAGDWILLRLFKLPAEKCRRYSKKNEHVMSRFYHALLNNPDFILVERISEFWSHEQSLQEAV